MSPTLELLQESEPVPGLPPTARWLQIMSDLHPRYGGMSAAVPELAQALAREQIEAPVAALCRPEEQFVPACLEPRDVHFLPRSRRAWVLEQQPSAVLDRVVRDCDGVHVHGLWTAASQAGSRASLRLGKPYCVSAHGMLEPWSLQQHRVRKQIYAALIENRVLRKASCLIALTRSEAQSYRQIAPRIPVALVANGVDVPEAISDREFLQAHPVLTDKRILLFLSRLHPKKGIDRLLRAWARVPQHYRAAHLVIAGAGEPAYVALLQGIVQAEGLEESVTFTGLLQGSLKWSAMRAAECFVLPSHSEGLSVAILEALGAGTPVLATPACNMPELESFRCGWLTSNEEEALSGMLQHVLEHTPAQNRAVGQRGRVLIRERYTWDAVARQMSEVYRWLQGGALPVQTEVLR